MKKRKKEEEEECDLCFLIKIKLNFFLISYKVGQSFFLELKRLIA
jgi:hypothetical protein